VITAASTKLYDAAYLDRMRPFLWPLKARSFSLLGPLVAKRIADIGCGTGDDAYHFAREGAEIYAVDHDLSLITAAKAKRSAPLPFILADAAQLPFPDASLDVIRFDRVLQHVQHREGICREAFRVLRDGGLLQVIDPDYESWSFFLECRSLERKLLEAVSHRRIPHAHAVRNLPALVLACGFLVEGVEGYSTLVKDRDFACSIIRFDRVFEELRESKSLSQEELAAWQELMTRPAPQFNLSLQFQILQARRPART
jgi:ubiquinone/menaquinone biosynthesis C-methylase UbiE